MAIRRHREAVPIWAKILASKLHIHPVVKQVAIRPPLIKVWYHTGVFERYNYTRQVRTGIRIYNVTEESGLYRHDIPIHQEYEVGPICLDPKLAGHFVIRWADFESATLVERRVAIHSLARKLQQSGIRFHYRQDILEHDLERVRNIPPGHYYRDHRFSLTEAFGSATAPGVQILQHFFPAAPAPTRLVGAITIVAKRARDITTARVAQRLIKLTKQSCGQPGGWMAIFKHLGVSSVLDLAPHRGQRALACAILGITYHAELVPELAGAIRDGFSDFVGLCYEPLDELTKADLLVSDGHLMANGVPAAIAAAGCARRLLAFVPAEDEGEYLERFRGLAKPPAVWEVNSLPRNIGAGTVKFFYWG